MPEKFSLQAFFKRIGKSDKMGTYEKFLIKEYTSIQKNKYVRQEEKVIIAISLVLKCRDVHFLILRYISGGETPILVNGKSWDFSRTKPRSTRLIFILLK